MRATFKRWAMAADARSVPLARRRVTSLLRLKGWNPARIDDVALITTELVTNAVTHARTPFMLTVELADRRLRVEIRDRCTAPPLVQRAPTETDIGGRGLQFVAALADRWGVEPALDGKSVWFESTEDRG